MRLFFLNFFMIILTGINLTAQNKPGFVMTSDPVRIIPPLSTMKSLPAPKPKDEEINPKRNFRQNIIVPGKGLPKTTDPVLQTPGRSLSHSAKSPILTFEAAHDGYYPSDPTGAAGPNHYVMAYNTAFKIFDKTGNVLVNETGLNTFFQGHTSDGDPIVLYDRHADRFLITNFDISHTPNKLLVAVSQTSDPVNGGWYFYAFDVPGTSTQNFIDYPKFSIWSDGYYITANKDAYSASTSDVVYVMERDKMINGETTAQMIGFPLPGINVDGFYSPSGFNINGDQLPPAGNAPIIYLQDDAWAGINKDHLKIWNINVDWNTPNNSTISNPQELQTSAFNSVFDNGSFQNLPQPNGTSIDALQATVMFMTNYRRFTDHNSAVLNFVVNTDNQGKAGIRWFELRQDNDGDPWYIYQEGTYIDPSNHHTFAGSINMDNRGNIALGYTIVDNNQVPELHYTGRMAADPLNQLTITSDVVTPGITSSNVYRYGDYAQLTVDPTDDKTFWFISEYFTYQGRADQVAVFKFAQDLDYDVGITDIIAPVSGVLSNNEQITAEITNYGLQSVSNFPVQYQIDNGTTVTENFTGTLAPGATANFTFTTTGDFSTVGHTYNLKVNTALSNDMDQINDSATMQVSNLISNDVGVTAILNPQSGNALGSNEQIQIKITNFGGVTQSNIPVSYTLNGQTVNETAPGPIDANSIGIYTFSQTGDFSGLGSYVISAQTDLPNDADNSNDSFSTTISHDFCQPTSDCSYGDRISNVQLESINNSSTCNSNGYSDYTNISTDLQAGNTYDMSVSVDYSDEHFTAWIDYNDNYLFENSEKIVNDYVFAPNTNTSGTFTHTFQISIPANANNGEHLMRLRIRFQNQISDACTNIQYGETEDYKINILGGAAVDVFEGNQIVIKTLDNNHFFVSLNSPNYRKAVTLTVYTMGGKQIVYHNLKNQYGQYTYDLNMQYVAKGVYLLRIGNDEAGKIKKIIVK